MRPTVFIHSNHRQRLGALVSAHSLTRNSTHAGEFDVKIIWLEDHPFFERYEGRNYLRGGDWRPWRNDDLQSFTPLRFMPPELMGYEGQAVIMDPDIFAAGDIYELLTRDMEGYAACTRLRTGAKSREECRATSVMLLDCAKLEHWKVEENFDELFTGQRDYMDWICLHTEDKDSLGLLEDHWNDFDRLRPETRLLHNTKRRTQPWKAGLPVDFIPAEKLRWFPPALWLQRARRRFFGDYGLLGRYVAHPDQRQTDFFFGLLRECLDNGSVTEDVLRDEMGRNHLRHDAFDLIERAGSRAA
jgi:hypothetical protein